MFGVIEVCGCVLFFFFLKGAGTTIPLLASSRASSGLWWSAAVEMSSAKTADELPSPFINFAGLVCDHSYLPTRFGGLVDNALVYLTGFVVRQVLRRLSCDVCCASLVTDAVHSSNDKSYHLLVVKNNGGLMIPSDGTVKVVRATVQNSSLFQGF